MKCKKCNIELDEGAIFCFKCGEKNTHEEKSNEENELCSKCNMKLTDTSNFCSSFGQQKEIAFLETRENDQITEETTNQITTKHRYGFSYVNLFRIFATITSVVIVILGYMIDISLDGSGIVIIIGFLLAVINYYLMMFGVKLFENIAVIAQNSDKIINFLENNKND